MTYRSANSLSFALGTKLPGAYKLCHFWAKFFSISAKWLIWRSKRVPNHTYNGRFYSSRRNHFANNN